MTTHRLICRTARRSAAVVCALAACAALGVAPAALAWDGSLQVRKVNLGGPQADTFGFKVEARAHGGQTWTLLPASDYTGAPWAAKPEPDNPFSLTGAPGPDGPFTRTGPAPTEALFAAIQTRRGDRRARAGDARLAVRPRHRDDRARGLPHGRRVHGAQHGVRRRLAARRRTSTGARGRPRRRPPGAVRAWRRRCASCPTASRRPTAARGPSPARSPTRTARGCGSSRTSSRRSTTPSAWTSPSNGSDVDTSAGGESFADGDASDWIAVDGGSDVTLAEQGAAGTVITDYDATLECRSGTGGTYGDWSVVPGGTSGTLSAVAARARLRVPLHEHRPHARRRRRDRDAAAERRLAPRQAPTPTARASARASGTSGCITSRFAIADVRGRGIASVTFRINGKRRTQLTAANIAGMYRLRVPASSLPRGASRVTAFVRFDAATGVQPKLLALAWSRCPRRSVVPPPFTG